jgi:protein TonB
LVGDLPERTPGTALDDHPRYLDVSSGVMAGNLVSAPLPDYPMLAKLAHVHGKVILQAVIGKDGSVSAAKVISGNRLLRGAAVDAVRQWRYKPYQLQGKPVDVSTIVTVEFHEPAGG